MKRAFVIILVLYITDFILDSIIAAYNDNSLRYVSKGLLMPLLLAFFITETKTHISSANKKYIWLICLALIFSFLGDVFLIGESSLNFMLGIAAFLLAQVCYVIFFTSIERFSKKHNFFLSIASVIILCYLFILNYLFYPTVVKQSFLIPVLAYSLVLGLMLFTSINLRHAMQLNKMNRLYFIAGAIIFVASDSMIGFNSFYLPGALPGFYIMLTYCIAQFLIVSGAIKFVQHNKGAECS